MDKPETYFKLTLNSQTDKAEKENQAKDVFFSQQYHKTVTPIFRYLFSHVQNIHDAEDLTSQTFITAYENLAKLRDPTNLQLGFSLSHATRLMTSFEDHGAIPMCNSMKK